MLDRSIKFENLKEMMEKTVENFGERTAFYRDGKGLEDSRKISYKEFMDDIKSLGTALVEMGLKGKRIAVISHGGTIKFYLLSFCKVNERLNLEYKENELAINSPCLLKMTFRKNELVNLEQMKL